MCGELTLELNWCNMRFALLQIARGSYQIGEVYEDAYDLEHLIDTN